MASFLIPGATEIVVGELPASILPERVGRAAVAVLAQESAAGVADDAAGRLGADLAVSRWILPDGESAKTWQVIAGVHDWFAEIGLGRGDTVMCVGGGAATDAGGFAAATWMRGVESVYVPTTLLGAVDASIGGKTGINVGGKNLVGAFWHPTRVLIDPSVFRSLPAEILSEGFAEAVKAGYLADPELVSLLQRDGVAADLVEVTERAVRVKVDVVTDDAREHGRRAILNYGHTLGHGIERAAGLRHGSAVAVGMVGAAEISRRRHGFDAVQEHRETLSALGLPIDAPDLDAADVLALVRLDKKRTIDGIRMVLLRGYADPIVEVVTEDDLRAGLAAVGIDGG